MTMTFTEQQLRESLRRTTTDVPDAGDRVAQVQRRVRRRRQRTIAVVAAVVALAVVAVPVTRAVVDRRAQVDVATPDPVAAQMDATMKYAAFVSWWNGVALGVRQPPDWDAGVTGVVVSATLPPTKCTVVTPAPGQPSGTQAAWVFGDGTVLTTSSGRFGMVTTYLLWPVGATGCDPRPFGVLLADPPLTPASALAAGNGAFASALDDPSRPALDLESVYRAVPPERLTQHGRDVFAAYQAALPKDYGTDEEKADRVLAVLASWIGNVMSGQLPTPQSPQTGPVLLTGDSYSGTAQLPAGYSARWDNAGAVCVEGSVGGSGVRHVSEDELAATMETGEPRASSAAGPCPSR